MTNREKYICEASRLFDIVPKGYRDPDGDEQNQNVENQILDEGRFAFAGAFMQPSAPVAARAPVGAIRYGGTQGPLDDVLGVGPVQRPMTAFGAGKGHGCSSHQHMNLHYFF
jgi:hypothetical protein